MCNMYRLIFQVAVFAIAVASFASAQITHFVSDKLEDQLSIFKQQSDLVLNRSTGCQEQLDLFFNEITTSSPSAKSWAWRMFDAWGKINAGILVGSWSSVGSFQECIDINELIGHVEMKGQYCDKALILPLVNMDIADLDLMPYFVSMCIPHKCKPSELIPAVSELGLINDNNCQSADIYKEFDAGDWAFIVFFVIIVYSLFLSTVYDITCRKNKSKPVPILLAFSIITNGEKILRISENVPGQMSCLNGLRSLSMVWVLAGHRYSSMPSLPTQNYVTMLNWMDTVYSQYIQAATVAVDTFFFLAGLLSAYGVLKTLSKPNSKFNLFMFYLHRYLRLTPAIAALFFFYITIMKHMGSGQLWPLVVDLEGPFCREYWYSYFLYIQNFVNPNERCLGHTWYLSADMQMFIVSPIILLPLVKYPKKTMLVLIGLIPLSVVPPILIIYMKEVLPTDISSFMKYYYVQPWTRISPWLIGALLGAILYRTRSNKIKINWILNLVIWVGVLAGMAAIVFATHGQMKSSNVLEFAFYSGFHRAAWGLGLMWIVFACQNGHGGFVNSFLSWPFFQVMARLSYSMYLTHIVVIYFTIFTKKTEQYFDELEYINLTLGDVFLVAIISFFFSIMFESPMVVFEKLIFGRATKPRPVDVENKPNLALSEQVDTSPIYFSDSSIKQKI